MLRVAAQNDNPEVLKLLLDAGAEVNRTNNEGDNPFWAACRHGRVENMKLLLVHGADPGPTRTKEALYTILFYPTNWQATLIKSHLDMAIWHMDIRMIKLLHTTGNCSNKDIHCVDKSVLERCVKPEVHELLHELASTPRLLLSYCRLAVRDAMRVRRPSSVNKLPLPQKLRDYLLFSDL